MAPLGRKIKIKCLPSSKVHDKELRTDTVGYVSRTEPVIAKQKHR
jgi:hypothetical protein